MSSHNMSHWNYRVYSVPCYMEGVEESENEYFLSIRSTYYKEDGSVAFFSNEPSAPGGETFEDLKMNLSLFEKSLSAPIIFLDREGNIIREQETREKTILS
jgi:hypothetical protein